jgi:hypothetical protein
LTRRRVADQRLWGKAENIDEGGVALTRLAEGVNYRSADVTDAIIVRSRKPMTVNTGRTAHRRVERRFTEICGVC